MVETGSCPVFSPLRGGHSGSHRRGPELGVGGAVMFFEIILTRETLHVKISNYGGASHGESP